MSTLSPRRRPVYPASLVAECRRMADAGWTAHRIHQLLQERGVDPCPDRSTVICWVDEAAYARYREQRRRRSATEAAATATFALHGNSPEYRAAFVRRLDEEGVKADAIAKVYAVVFGSSISPTGIRRLVSPGKGTRPRSKGTRPPVPLEVAS